jgi:hypothetical protein
MHRCQFNPNGNPQVTDFQHDIFQVRIITDGLIGILRADGFKG